MADVIPISGAHLAIGMPDKDIISFLRGLLARAEQGDIIGLGAYWVEGQNDILVNIEVGHARAALMVAGSSKLYDETRQRW
jgi:hypothetical protein